MLEDLLNRTLDMVSACDCETGCPACIQSPKCGNGNVPLDKDASILIMQMLLDKPEVQKLISQEADAADGEVALLPEAMPPAKKERKPRVLVFDLETKRSATEVGGWGNCHLMGMAMGVVWDSIDQKFHTYQEAEVNALVEKLKTGDLVVGFNHTRFDYAVLSGYTDFDFSVLPNFDILSHIYNKVGTRIKLDHLAQKTLGQAKSADGLESLKWVKEGRFDLVEEYCRKDVEITRNLFYFGLEKHKVIFENNQGELLELQLNWELEKIVSEARCNLGNPAGKR